ncbi:MAG: ABC-F family ATP-binding cassette domain-containing protein [Micropepsaceae bacterium]
MLRITNLTYRIEGRPLFEGATASIPTGHKVGLVGRNGTGKSTLFRILYGEAELDDGEIVIPRAWRIGGVAQEAPGGPMTLLDTVLIADVERTALIAESETATDPVRIAEIETRLSDIGAHRAPARAAEILAGLGFDAAAQLRPCSEFSGGWRMRVALAAVLFSQPDLLLLDEPTNYLDLEGSLWLEQFLRRFPGTMILISHDRDLLNTAVNSILHLEDKKLTFYTGTYDTFERTRSERLALQDAARTKQDAQRKHMQAFVDRFRYKASKARQAQSRLKAIAKLQPIAGMTAERVAPFRLGEPEEMSPPLLALESVSTGYDGREVLGHMDLRIDPDDRIALLGANGNGKSTFAKLISNRLASMSGSITKARRLRIGYFAQHQLDEMAGEQTPVQYLMHLMPRITEREARTRLGAAGFPDFKVSTAIEDLSGGERARLLIMIAALDAPHLLILDEPTNHLDIDSRESLVMALNDYTGAVLLISHDPHLIETCADRLWLVANGRVQPYDGDMDDYRKLLLEDRQPAGGKTKGAPKLTKAEERKAAADRRAQLTPLKRAADDAEKRVTKLQGEIAKVEAALNAPDLYATEPAKVLTLTKQRGEFQRQLEAAETAWLEASDAYESGRAEIGLSPLSAD